MHEIAGLGFEQIARQDGSASARFAAPVTPGIRHMETQSKLEHVRTFKTRGGNTRFVVRDSEGNEYTAFREEIGERARKLQGRLARITYHGELRDRYHNVYLDDVEPTDATAAAGGETDAQ